MKTSRIVFSSANENFVKLNDTRDRDRQFAVKSSPWRDGKNPRSQFLLVIFRLSIPFSVPPAVYKYHIPHIMGKRLDKLNKLATNERYQGPQGKLTLFISHSAHRAMSLVL